MSILNEKLENPVEGWATLDEAASMVGFDTKTVMYWADQGYITAYPVGRRVRIVNIEQVQAYAAERRRTRKLNKYAGKIPKKYRNKQNGDSTAD